MPVYTDADAVSTAKLLGVRSSTLSFVTIIGDDVANDSAALQDAIDSVASTGNRNVLQIAGTSTAYRLNTQIVIPSNVYLVGDGGKSKFRRGANLAAGEAMFSVVGENCGLIDIEIDGDVTTSAGVDYATISDPMAANFTLNTSVWIRSGAKNVKLQRVTVQHTGGYAVIIDARTGDIREVLLDGCQFKNNRPHKFGPAGDMNYGSWTGGVLYTHDGTSFGVHGLHVRNCHWRRCTGNCLWGHGYAFNALHTGHVYSDLSFEDFGLDAFEPGNTIGAVVSNIRTRRGGFLHSTDIDTASPLTNPNTYSVAFDSTGCNQGMSITGLTVLSQNGGAIDLDGMHDSTFAGVTLSNHLPGDPLYIADSVASFGPTKGVQTGNSFYGKAGRNITFQALTILNFNTNAISLKNAKNCHFDVNIYHPSTASSVPVLVFCVRGENQTYAQWQADSTEHRSYNNTIEGIISYSGGNFGVAEVAYNDGVNSYSFNAADNNRVNVRMLGTGNLGSWLKHSSSGSAARSVLPTNDPAASSLSQTIIQREGFGATAALKIYKDTGTPAQLLQLSDAAFLNISAAGVAGTGAIATGNRSSLGFDDAVATSVLVADGFIAINATTFSAVKANALDDTWILLRRNPAANGDLEVSLSRDDTDPLNPVRVWADLSSGGTPGGATTQVQYNNAGAFAGNSAFVWNNTTKVLTITGLTGTAGIVAATSYIHSQEGFFTQSVNTDSIQSPNGGVTAKYLISTESIFAIGIGTAPGVSGAGQAKLYADASGVWKYSQNGSAWATAFGVGTVGGATTQVQYNNAGAFAGSASFTWDNVAKLLTVTGVTGTASIAVATSYIQSAEGFYTPDASSDAINAPLGGVTALSLISVRNDGAAGLTLSRTAATARTWGLGVGGSGELFAIDNSVGVRFSISTAGLVTVGVTLAVQGLGAGIAGITLASGYMDAANGYYTASTSYQAVQAPNGGMYARSHHSNIYTDLGQNSGAPTATSGATIRAGNIYWDTAAAGYRYYNGSSWQAFGGGTPGGANTQVQFNDSGVFGGDTSLTWDKTGNILTVTGKSYVINDAAASIAAIVQGAVSQSANLMEWRNSAGTALAAVDSAGAFYGAAFAARSAVSGSSTTESKFGTTDIRFKQAAGDQLDSGVISYGVIGVSTSLNIIGKGTGTRVVRLYDDVYIGGSGNIALDDNGNISCIGVIAANGASAGVNVTGSTAYNSIQTSGGMYATGTVHSAKQILAGGFVGDPGTSANSPFHATSNGQCLYIADAYGGNVSGIIGRSARGSYGAASASGFDDQLMSMGGRGHDGSGFTSSATAAVQFFASEAYGGSNQGAEIRFATTQNAVGSAAANRKTRWSISHDGILRVHNSSGTAVGGFRWDGAAIEFSNNLSSWTDIGGGGGAVSSVNAGGNGIAVSPTTGAVFVSLSTTANVVLNALQLNSSATNALAVTGGINCNAIYTSNTAFNSIQSAGGVYVSGAGQFGGQVTCAGVDGGSSGIKGGGYNPFVGGTQYFGQTVNIDMSVYVGTLVFKGGVLVSY